MKQNKVISNLIVYTALNFLVKAFSFVLLPIYTVYLTTEDYGILNMSASFTSTVSIIITCNLSFATSRFYAEYSLDKKKVARLFGTILSFSFCSANIFCIVFLVFRNMVTDLIFTGVFFFPTVMLILLTIPFYCLFSLYLDIMRGMQKAKRSSFISLIFFFVNLGMNIYLIVIRKMGVDGALLSGLLMYIAGAAWMLFDLLKNKLLYICIDFKILKNILKYSVPIIPHSLSSSITQLLSKLFISGASSLSAVGIYGLASQFGAIAELIQGSVSTAYQPWLYEQLERREDGWKENIVSLIEPLLWVLGLLFIGLSLFSHEAILIMADKSYSEAWRVVPLIIGVFIIKTPYYFYIAILFYFKKASKWVFTATLSSNLVNVIASYFLIKRLGMYGSVIADGIAMALLIIIVVAMSKKFDDIGYKLRPFIKHMFINIVFITTGLSLSYVIYYDQVSIINILFKVTVVLVYIAIGAYSQRKKIVSIISSRRLRRK